MCPNQEDANDKPAALNEIPETTAAPQNKSENAGAGRNGGAASRPGEQPKTPDEGEGEGVRGDLMKVVLAACISIALLLLVFLILPSLDLSCPLFRIASAALIAAAVAVLVVSLGGMAGLDGEWRGVRIRTAGGFAAFVLCAGAVFLVQPATCDGPKPDFVIRAFPHAAGWSGDEESRLFAHLAHTSGMHLADEDERTRRGLTTTTTALFLTDTKSFKPNIEIFAVDKNYLTKLNCDITIIRSETPPDKTGFYLLTATENFGNAKPYALTFDLNLAKEPLQTNRKLATSSSYPQDLPSSFCLKAQSARQYTAERGTDQPLTRAAGGSQDITIKVENEIWIVSPDFFTRVRALFDPSVSKDEAIYIKGSPAAVPTSGATAGEAISPTTDSGAAGRAALPPASSLPLPADPTPIVAKPAASCDMAAVNNHLDATMQAGSFDKNELGRYVEEWNCLQDLIADKLAKPEDNGPDPDTRRLLLDLVRSVTSEADSCWSITGAKRDQRKIQNCRNPSKPAQSGLMRDLDIALPWTPKLRSAILGSLRAGNAQVRTGAQLNLGNYPASTLKTSLAKTLKATSPATLGPDERVRMTYLSEAYARLLYNRIYEYYFADMIDTNDIKAIDAEMNDLAVVKDYVSPAEYTALEAYLHYARAVTLSNWKEDPNLNVQPLVDASYGKLRALDAQAARYYRFPHHIAAAVAQEKDALKTFSQLDGAKFDAVSGGANVRLAKGTTVHLTATPQPSGGSTPSTVVGDVGVDQTTANAVVLMKYGDWDFAYVGGRWGWTEHLQSSRTL